MHHHQVATKLCLSISTYGLILRMNSFVTATARPNKCYMVRNGFMCAPSVSKGTPKVALIGNSHLAICTYSLAIGICRLGIGTYCLGLGIYCLAKGTYHLGIGTHRLDIGTLKHEWAGGFRESCGAFHGGGFLKTVGILMSEPFTN